MSTATTFDPLILETFWSRLISTVEQQAVALIRTSFTPSVAECGDLSACVFDPRGYMLAQAVTGTPGHINSMDEYDLDSIIPLADELIARSERAMRVAIEALPDGSYQYETDTDGFDAPIHLALTLTVSGEHVVADYAGTSPQVQQAINVVMNYSEAYTTFGLKCALAPDVPNNEGSFRAVTVRAPEGSVLNCRHPAPVAARHLLGHFLAGMVLAALAPVLPDRAMAEGMAGLWSTNIHGIGPDGHRFTLLSFLSGGMGARLGLDGLSSTAFPSGVSGIPTEVFENRSPLVMLEREFRQDSGGPGRNRGGLGHRIVYSGLRLREPYRLSPFTDRVRHPAPGLQGGMPGAPGQFQLADGTPLNAKSTVVLAPDQSLTIGLPGGGGIGDPKERDPELVRQDVLDGLVSLEHARDAYGLAFTEAGEVDSQETQRLRRAL